MKIIKYKKLKNDIYRIFFEEDYIDVSEDLILKYDLLYSEEIDSELRETLILENSFYLGYNLALKYLKTKMRSIKEMRSYLLDKDIKKNEVEKIIERLIELKYLDDNLFAKAYINDRINLSNDGPYKIRKYLSDLEINEDVIENELANYTEENELEKVRKNIMKRLKGNKNKSSYLLKKKIYEDLMNLGFTKEIIYMALEELSIDDEDAYLKQKERLYNKLSKKFDGKELEFRLKNELYKLGFKE